MRNLAATASEGDGEATISEEEQQSRTVSALLDWLGNLR